eukprot:5336854-Prymnesium_polylepis.1
MYASDLPLDCAQQRDAVGVSDVVRMSGDKVGRAGGGMHIPWPSRAWPSACRTPSGASRPCPCRCTSCTSPCASPSRQAWRPCRRPSNGVEQ